jgi:membrane-associated protein
MEIIQQIFDVILHVDRHLSELWPLYGTWMYAILFTIVFCETGLVVTPFLPGDSLLFAVGSLAVTIPALRLEIAIPLLIAAALTGDNVNYWIGRTLGPKVFHKEKSIFLNKEYLTRTQHFYEKHGGKAIMIARFFPIIRTFAPFVAGIGKMKYARFLLFSITGACIWVFLFTLTGYSFGNVPIIKQNFSLVIIAIILISGIPALVGFVRHVIERRKISNPSHSEQ